MPVQVSKNRNGDHDVGSNGMKTENLHLYTEEQRQAVDQILQVSDYYDILGIDKDASEAEIRKKYKKMALQLHPDKNKAPGAVEAFKAIGSAFNVLTDSTRKERYDKFGSDAMKTQPNPAREGDITPEELYHMFFEGHAFQQRGTHWEHYEPRPPPPPRSYTREEIQRTVVQMTPLLVVVCITMLSSFLYDEPAYSLQKSTKYIYEKRTSYLDVPYYVRENFLDKHKARIRDIEKSVEEEFVTTVRTSCFRERNYKENMIYRAKQFRDISLETKARELRTPSCDMLNELYKSLY